MRSRMDRSISASIVAYKDNPDTLAQAIDSVLNTELDVQLYVVDNSPTDELSVLCQDPRIKYLHNERNIGFGRGHNRAMRQILESSKYHLVLNPDIYFNGPTLTKLFKFMEDNPKAGLAMPKILNPDGSIQYLCKLLPTPFTLISRRFLKLGRNHHQKNNFRYEMRFTNYDEVMEVPFLSGCFMFLRTEALKKVGLFDERMFMYVEDTDLTRRVSRYFHTLFYPDAHVYHQYAKGSYKSLRLMLYNSYSAIVYFNKWGWIFDKDRRQINQSVLSRYNGKV